MAMNKIAQQLNSIGEPFAAGFMELPEGSTAQRFCRAYRRFYETRPMNYVENSPLFPSGKISNGDIKVNPQYCVQFYLWSNTDAFIAKCKEAGINEAYEAFMAFNDSHSWEGFGWSHSSLNYRRVLAEGINGYEQRLRALEDCDFKEALLDLISGIRTYHSRAVAYLKEINADEMLIRALEKVPIEPAETAYEALVASNFILYLDECDNIGRVDSWLYPYWKGEDLVDVMHRMLENVQDNGGWSVALGPDYNPLTKQWLEASKGLARPMLELRVTEEMPEDLWELALEKVLSGGGQPSFYNEKAIQRRLRERIPFAPEEDIKEFCGVGCTETSFGGMTYCGGIDLNLNVLSVLEAHMHENLEKCDSFHEFYQLFTARLRSAQDEMVKSLNAMYNGRSERLFAPIRTLFVDDCIDRRTGFLQGGARYSFAVPSESGIPNTADSLLAIKKLVYEDKEYTPEAFLKGLKEQDPLLKARLWECPCYGTGNAQADALVKDLTHGFYAYYREAKMDIGLGVFPTSHQFVRHVEEGAIVGATPDGRYAGQAVADSIAAVNGKAVKGPTRMLLSAASYDQEHIYGIPVLNLSITKAYDPKILRALIEGYFAMGGTQMQITCTTRETLMEARKDPESHRDLIVRVGGYSEYFRNLTDELKDAVIARTMFTD